ncbi:MULTISPECIES: MarR family winged helix-turn-helix transcriptional regulator [Mesobacillus]|uniref:MarR family transcriptional regulator n=1 Tax=Mesobacillus selenatarsenatis TaxID=388741 RepID=A0A846TX51_9BACI|nr:MULTISPECIES: MarR family transcriptional regulator [Mesobacillus]NKE06911.1 MarR family transcriptional regulator [Mesobacillus selenatarsenatis]
MDLSMDKAVGSVSVRLSKRLTRIINLYLKPYQITTEQWSVLRTLSEYDEISQKELSLRSDKDQATLTKILDLLVKQENVERTANPLDRRSFLVKITPKGAKIAAEVTPYLEEVFTKITHGIDEERLEIFRDVSLTLEFNIEKLLEENK